MKLDLSIVEECVTEANCDVCGQVRIVKYCKFCHAYICDACRLNYPERIRAMLRKHFSSGLHGDKNELESEYANEITETPLNRCGIAATAHRQEP